MNGTIFRRRLHLTTAVSFALLPGLLFVFLQFTETGVFFYHYETAAQNLPLRVFRVLFWANNFVLMGGAVLSVVLLLCDIGLLVRRKRMDAANFRRCVYLATALAFVMVIVFLIAFVGIMETGLFDYDWDITPGKPQNLPTRVFNALFWINNGGLLLGTVFSTGLLACDIRNRYHIPRAKRLKNFLLDAYPAVIVLLFAAQLFLP